MWTIFKVFTECVTISLLFFMFCFGLFDHEVCGISAPGLGIEPTPPTLEGKVLTTGPLGKPHPMGVLTVGSEGWDLLRLSSPHTLLMDLCPCGFLHWVPPPSPPQSALCTAAVSPLPYPAHRGHQCTSLLPPPPPHPHPHPRLEYVFPNGPEPLRCRWPGCLI